MGMLCLLWMRGAAFPITLQPGQYTLKFKLYSNQEEKEVFIALDPERLDENNDYAVATLTIGTKD